jgi:hypothetical protein
MRTLKPTFIVLAVFFLASFSRDIEPGTAYTPILLKKDDLPKSVFFKEAQDFENPGKIYLYGSGIYIVDSYKGIHVIDNQDKANPTKTGFIHIPGVMDVAIRDEVLYADNAVDLVAINLRNYPEISVISRAGDVFPELLPPDLNGMPSRFQPSNRPKNTVIVGWYK